MPSTTMSQFGRERRDRVARPGRGALPVRRPAGAPRGVPVRLVLQVGADDVGLVAVAPRQRLPSRDPGVLVVAGLAIPEPVAVAVVGQRVVLEQDHEPRPRRGVDDDVHRLLRRLALQRGVLAAGEVRARDRRGGVQRLQRERQADRVEAHPPDLAHHVVEVARPQAVDDVRARLEAEPVEPLQHDRAPVAIDDLRAGRPQRRGDHGSVRGRSGHEGECDGEDDRAAEHAIHLIPVCCRKPPPPRLACAPRPSTEDRRRAMEGRRACAARGAPTVQRRSAGSISSTWLITSAGSPARSAAARMASGDEASYRQ